MHRTANWTVARLVLVLFSMTAMPLTQADSDSKPDGQFVATIEYRFVGHLGRTDEKGRVLVWEAEAKGGVSGTMKWWFVDPPPISESRHQGGRLSFYAARWELWDEEELLLAGETAGKTNFPDGADGVWDGHGRVTEARGKYEFLKGRSVYETGPVIIGSDPPESFSGTGVFVIH